MYKSPIKANFAEPIYEQVQDAFDNAVFKAVQEMSIEVDKDELIKALQYDRDQYDKGYRDGRVRENVQGEWIESPYFSPLSDGTKIAYKCSVCFTHWDHKTNYCPYCGADMSESC